MLLWVWIAVVIVAVLILLLAALPLLRRLAGLQRAGEKLQRRQAEALKLQDSLGSLEETVLGLQARAETMQERIAIIQAGRGESGGKHAYSEKSP